MCEEINNIIDTRKEKDLDYPYIIGMIMAVMQRAGEKKMINSIIFIIFAFVIIFFLFLSIYLYKQEKKHTRGFPYTRNKKKYKPN